MGCNYLSLPFIPASGTQTLICPIYHFGIVDIILMDAILYGMKIIHWQKINHVFMIILWLLAIETVGQVMDKDIMDGVYVGCMIDQGTCR